MIDFDVQRCTRKCAATERELQPGETIYSVLVPQGAEVVRQDYSAQAWQGPPEKSLGWWKSEIPYPDQRKVTWAPNEVITQYFHDLTTREEMADSCYVLALLMIRRRLLRLEETERDEQRREVMVLFCPGNEQEYRVVVTEPSAERIVAIQEELAKLLFED